MHDRLNQFLSMEKISPARFAEMLGIQRSGVSHLLSGRNKPSWEFLQKMLTTFPDINSEWLILGTGRPYKSDSPKSEILPSAPSYTEEGLFQTIESDAQTSVEQPFQTDYNRSYRAENRKFEEETDDTPAECGKKIARIIVFFNDGTYEEK